MNDLFVHTLRDVCYAEKQIVKALPEMIEKFHEPQFNQGLQTYLRETKNHVKRLEKIFQIAGVKAQGLPVSSRRWNGAGACHLHLHVSERNHASA